MTCCASEPCKSDSERILPPLEMTGGVQGWPAGISLSPACLQSGWHRELGVMAPQCCLLWQLLVLNKSLKPLGVLSPPCYKMGLSLMVSKLFQKAAAKLVVLTDIFVVVLTFFSVVRIQNSKKMFHASLLVSLWLLTVVE